MAIRLLAPFLLAFALAACDTQGPEMLTYDTGKAVRVDRVRVQHAMSFAAGSATLRADEAMELEKFVDQSGVRPNDRVFVAMPSGDPLATARLANITSLLARRGVDTQSVPPPPSGVARDHALVLIDRYIAKAPACPDWSGSPATSHENMVSSNFGCASAANFAAMIDNPHDLVVGRPFGPYEAEPSLGAVERYRSETVKPLLSAGGSGGAAAGAPGGAGSSQSSSSSAMSSGASTGGTQSQ